MRARRQLLEALERLQPHDHLCLIYETQQEQFAAAIPFLRIGLERGEKCIYIADDNAVSTVLEAMRAQGMGVDSALQSGALSLATKQEAYLKQGYFDPDWMIGFLKQTTEAALSAGFSALRVTGEMTWALGGDPGAERLMEYESRLNYLLSEIPCLAICQYNRQRFSPEVILDVIRTHPIVVYGGTVCRNFYYVPPGEFLAPNQPPREVERLLTNIREREQVENELRRARDELEARVRERTAELELFTYSVSHDLRAPVRQILSFARLLAEEVGPHLDPQPRKHLAFVQQASERMERMLDGLLKLSQAGRRELAKRVVELRPLLEGVLADLKSDLEGRQIELEIGELPAAECDPDLIRQVFANLLSNAVKFTRPRERAIIQVGHTALDGRPVIFVRDNGVGFDMKSAGKLFGVFQRLHGREDFAGTGIGLATVQRIVQKHGGRVWAESQPDQGATFYFSLS